MKNFKSGFRIQQNYYKSFQPNIISRAWQIDDMEVFKLLSDADRMVGKLDMFSDYVPNVDLFISMHVAREANQSSKIEGTQTHFDEVIKEREDIPEEHRDDWQEVQNYITALNYGINRLDKLPLSSRFIREVHKLLLDGVRGRHKNPGEFRTSQNWIGGASISDSTFIPPHQDTVPDLMSDMEKFMHNSTFPIPELLKIAIIHYQFETIHPFLDGNGRVGRLMIPLYLMEKKILKRPVLYISDFFERNRRIYYDKLTDAREKNDISGWLKFFLVGITETAEDGIKAFDKILKLSAETAQKVQGMGRRAAAAQKIIEQLYKSPFIKISKIIPLLNVTHTTAYSMVKDLMNLRILNKLPKSHGYESYYVFSEYLDIFKNPKD